jgi:hypothetical protein
VFLQLADLNAWALSLGSVSLASWDYGFESRRDQECLKSLCDGTITRPEESYWVWCVLVWSRNLKNEEA